MYEAVLTEKNIAVILIDMQTDFVRKFDPLALQELVDNQTILLEQARLAKVPIAVLEFHGYGNTIHALNQVLRKDPFCPYFSKDRNSGFSCRSFTSWLECKAFRTLLLTGINAHACVKATAASALDAGYEVVTAPELIDDKHKRDRSCYMPWYEQNVRLLAA